MEGIKPKTKKQKAIEAIIKLLEKYKITWQEVKTEYRRLYKY